MARGMNLQIQVRGVTESADALEEVGRRALDGTPAFSNIQSLLLTSERKLWSRFKRGRLVKSGTLKRSLTEGEARMMSFRGVFRRHVRSTSTTTGAIREIYPERMRFGTSVPYSVYHQHKGSGTKNKVLVFRPADKKQAKDIIAEYLTSGWND